MKLTPFERIPLSITRVVRNTSHYGKPYCTPLNNPVILEIVEIEPHTCHGDKWTTGDTCVICWGCTHIVKLRYAQEGYGADFGGRFDATTDLWVWNCWAD